MRSPLIQFFIALAGSLFPDVKTDKKRYNFTEELNLLEKELLKVVIMAKSMDAKKTEKKEPLKTPKEKKAEKREKKANKK